MVICVESWIQKQQWRNFQFIKFSFIDFVLTDRRSLSGKRPKSACGKSSSCRFSLLAARNAITKATEYVTLGFSFRILVFFTFLESLNLTACEQYGFFNVLAAIIWGSPDKLPWIENREGFAVQTWPSGAKGDWRVSNWLAISSTREKIYLSYKLLCYGEKAFHLTISHGKHSKLF